MTTKQRGADASDAPSRTDLYSRITGKIIADLEQGVRPWHRPWNAGNMAGRVTRPLRHNGIPYQGINTIMLWMAAVTAGYQSWSEKPIVNRIKRFAIAGRECPENGGIMPRWLTARFGWHAAEIGGPIQSRAFHCRPRSEPEAGDQHLFGTSASAAICSFAD